MPPYYPQTHRFACSLAVLRSVLAVADIEVSEEELIGKIQPDYGEDFKNLWNPTIAKLTTEYGIRTKMYARWPLFKPEILDAALKAYRNDPAGMDVRKYENPNDKDRVGEPLPLAYKEMFKAVENGCGVLYGGLTARRIARILYKGHYIQTSIKTSLLYPGERSSFHSILIFKHRDSTVTYHDPARQASMQCSIARLLKAANGTGAFMEYAV